MFWNVSQWFTKSQYISEYLKMCFRYSPTGELGPADVSQICWHMMFHNVSKCQTISHITPQCFVMSQNISEYLTMSYNISECVPRCGFNILSAKNWSLHMSPKYADTYRRAGISRSKKTIHLSTETWFSSFLCVLFNSFCWIRLFCLCWTSPIWIFQNVPSSIIKRPPVHVYCLVQLQIIVSI